MASILPNEVEDINNYLNRTALIDSNEYLFSLFFIWDYFFEIIYHFSGYDNLIFVIRFILCFILIIASLRQLNHKIFVLIILFSPFIIEHFLGGLRQGLAFVLFIIGYYFNNLALKILLFLLILFVHPLSIWWLATFFVAWIAFKFESKLIILGFSVILLFLINYFFTSVFIQNLLGYEDRYILGNSGRSILGLLVWIIISLLHFLGNNKRFDYYFILLSIVQLIVLYSSFESVFRFIQSLLPIFIIYHSNNVNKIYSKLTLSIYIFYVCLHWFLYYEKIFL